MAKHRWKQKVANVFIKVTMDHTLHLNVFRLVEKKSQLDKRMLIGKGKSECIKQNNHNTSVCINQVVEDLLQCHLPWMKNLNSTLRTCNSTEDFKKYYNILKTKESLVREKCILVQNCIQYDWVIKHIVQGDTGDITNMTELYFAPLSDEVILILWFINLPNIRQCQ